MSVINQVLQQLEQRRAPAAGSGGSAPLAAVPARVARGTRRLTVIAGLGIAAVSLAAFGDWPSILSPKRATPRAEATSPPAEPAASAVLQARAEVLSPAATAIETPALPAAPVLMAAAPVARPAAVAEPPPPPAMVQPAAPIAPPMPAPLAPPLPALRKSAVNESPEQRARELASAAQESAHSGHRQLAIERAQQALKLDATLHGTRHLAAALLAETGRTGDAEALLRERLDDKNFPRPAALLLARLVAERGDNDAALALIDRFELRDADALGLRGALHARQGDAPRARAAYEAAVQIKPQQASWWLGLAIALEAEQLAPKARDAYARARAIGLVEPELAAYADARLRALN